MNDADLQKIKDALPLIADLIEENELLCSSEPCPKCGFGWDYAESSDGTGEGMSLYQ